MVTKINYINLLTSHLTKTINPAATSSQSSPATAPPPTATTTSQDQPYEWRRLVGSIRRRVQRHASNCTPSELSSNSKSSDFPQSSPLSQTTSISRKGSLTHAFSLRREKSRDSANLQDVDSSAATSSSSSSTREYFKLKSKNFKSFNKSRDDGGGNKVKKELFGKMKDSFKGGNKADHAVDKPVKSKWLKSNEQTKVNRDDFLKATMRIFLVVSPPVGKLQVSVFFF